MRVSGVIDSPLDLHLLFFPLSGVAMAPLGPYIDKLLGLRGFRIVLFATLLQMINREVADRPVRTKLQEADRSIQRNIPKYTTCLSILLHLNFRSLKIGGQTQLIN